MQILRTVRHLRPEQIAGQIAHRWRRAIEDPAKILNWQAPPFPGVVWKPAKPFLAPVQQNRAADLEAGNLTFLNQINALGWPPDWNQTNLNKLWLYNLQYFDCLWELNLSEARGLVLDWIDRHTPNHRRIGWEPYPTSLRLMNWCAVFFGKFRAEVEADRDFASWLWQSIYRQARWLDGHVETHLMGNHVLENAAALTMVGCCFGGNDARHWFEHGLELLGEQVNEQFLSDGGHFERSPMYHCKAVYVLLMLGNLNRPEVSESVHQAAGRGLRAAKMLAHPDGQIALLNDSALGIYNEPDELAKYAGSVEPSPVGAFALPETGYFGYRGADGSCVICDAGPIGPDYQPGHAHGDLLSFELSLHGHRVIVDAGVHDYEIGPMRDYCRSTRAHNTVEIDGRDQCEFWGAFRVGRRAHVQDVRWMPQPDGFELSAAHDGYAPTKHRRTFTWRGGELTLRDEITGVAGRKAVARLHLHPDCRIEQVTPKQVIVAHAAGKCVVDFAGNADVSVEDSWYCPEFGMKLKNQALAWSATSDVQASWVLTIRSA